MENLVEVVGQWRKLRSLRIQNNRGVSRGLDSEEVLGQQLQVLIKARESQPHLETFSVKSGVVWTADGIGRWTATYSCPVNKNLVLFSPLDYMAADQVIPPAQNGESPQTRICLEKC